MPMHEKYRLHMEKRSFKFNTLLNISNSIFQFLTIALYYIYCFDSKNIRNLLLSNVDHIKLLLGFILRLEKSKRHVKNVIKSISLF